jgi:hypothetical protein
VEVIAEVLVMGERALRAQRRSACSVSCPAMIDIFMNNYLPDDSPPVAMTTKVTCELRVDLKAVLVDDRWRRNF